MPRLTWDDRNYYSGADHAVVYVHGGNVEVWNGLTAVTEKPSDIRTRIRYQDGRRSLNQRADDSFAATLECFTYPEVILGARTVFDMTYRVMTGKGYELHLVYNAIARPSGGVYKQQNELTPFTIDVSTKPRVMPLLLAPSAHIIIDTVLSGPEVVNSVEDILYGTTDQTSRMPLPEDLLDIFQLNNPYRVIDNGDGTFTLIVPDDALEWIDPTEFEVEWPNPLTFIDENTYTIQNW